jgi:hypothetical protein
VRADYENWRKAIPPSGHLLFHDAATLGDLSSAHDDVVRVVTEIERDDARYFRRAGGAGTVLHLQRTAVPFDKP